MPFWNIRHYCRIWWETALSLGGRAASVNGTCASNVRGLREQMRSSIPVASPSKQWSLLGMVSPSASSQPAGLVETKLSQIQISVAGDFLHGCLLLAIDVHSLLFFLGKEKGLIIFPEWMILCERSYALLSHPCFLFYFLFPKQKSISVNQNNFFLAPVIFFHQVLHVCHEFIWPWTLRTLACLFFLSFPKQGSSSRFFFWWRE